MLVNEKSSRSKEPIAWQQPVGPFVRPRQSLRYLTILQCSTFGSGGTGGLSFSSDLAWQPFRPERM